MSTTKKLGQISTKNLLLVSAGLGLILGGSGPMLWALNRSNQVLDNGSPHAQEIISNADSWAFTLPNVAMVLVGITLLVPVVLQVLGKKAETTNE